MAYRTPALFIETFRANALRPDLGDDTLLLPIRSDPTRLAGIILTEGDLEVEAWHRVDPALPWRRGRVPVALREGTTSGPPLAFWTDHQLARHRVEVAAEHVGEALRLAGSSLLDAASLLEHADDLLGGHPVTTAALLALSEKHPQEPALGDPALLRRRFRAAAPTGLQALQRELGRPAFGALRSTDWANALAGAAVRSGLLNGELPEEAWSRCGEQTLWSWWLHWKAGSRGASLRAVANELGLSPDSCVRLAKGETRAEEVAESGQLPSREQALADLAASFCGQPSSHRVGFTSRAHRRRLVLFARQLGALERALSPGPLGGWSETREVLHRIRTYLGSRRAPFPWVAARDAADAFRTDLALGDGGISLADQLGRLGLHLAGASLAYASQQGGWNAEPDAAPVLFLTPAALARSAGAVRFAVLHQLGHLVEGSARPCTKWVDEEAGADEDEAFANAFAAYLAAPRESVQELLEPSEHPTEDQVRGAARDTALQFGMSSAAALHHVLSCAGLSTRLWQQRLAADTGWRNWVAGVDAKVSDLWETDRTYVVTSCRGTEETTARLALERPNSALFEDLLHAAVAEQLVPAEVGVAYGLPRAE